MADTIGLMRSLFRELAEGYAHLPDRTVLTLKNRQDSVLFMPGYLPRIQGLGIKVISVFPSNLARKIPTASAKVLLLDTETGESLALLDGATITAMRTAAVSAVAADILARKDADTLGLFGAGIQGRSHLEAIREIRSLRKVMIFDPDPQRTEQMIAELPDMWKTEMAIQAGASPDELLDCSIIITATTSDTPVFTGRLLKPGTHVGAVGSYKPHVREIDGDAIARMRIYVDRIADALEEAGDLIIPIESGEITEDSILGELSDLITGRIQGRNSADDITFFKSVGLAVEDIIVARHIYDTTSEKA
jgi:ornithine cyclodeaminase/alanine dehydrogenase-like protein (mu-crystallin family)